jgi:hypothetical protein
MNDDIFNALLKFVREEISVASAGLSSGAPAGGSGLGVKIKTKKDKKFKRKKAKLISFKEYLEY